MSLISQEEAVRRVATLTEQEREFVRMLCDDEKQAGIGARMDVSKGRVGQLRTIVGGKLGRFSLAGIGYVIGLAEGAE